MNLAFVYVNLNRTYDLVNLLRTVHSLIVLDQLLEQEMKRVTLAVIIPYHYVVTEFQCKY